VGRLGIVVGLLFAIVVGTGPAPSGTSVASESLPPGWIVYSAGELPLVPVRRQLVVARPDGSEATPVTTASDDFSPQWAPDGQRIVFVRSAGAGRTEIWLVNADGTGTRPLDQDHPYAEHPRWSPDGRWIAYQVQTSTNIYSGRRAHTTFELWLVRPDGSERFRLVKGDLPLENDNPQYKIASGTWSWSPDSRRIAYVRNGIRIVEVPTGRTYYRGRGQDVAWSPDGRRLAATVSPEDLLIGQPDCGSVWIVPRRTGKRTRLTRDALGLMPPRDVCDRWPRWSPTGHSVVFARSTSEGGRGRLFTVSVDGERLQRVVALSAARYIWPSRCSGMFEYASGFGSGWIVRPSAQGAPRFVTFPIAGTPRCDTDRLEPCAAAGDWRC
jgi:Tol biopolymer transport system component